MRLKEIIYIFVYACMLLCQAMPVYGQIRDFDFRKISLKDGLTQSSAFAIYQDYRGFIWIGTSNGLNRYDGKSITQFIPDDEGDRSESISGGNIWGLDGDGKSRLYITTYGGGLNILNYDDLKITTYKKSDTVDILDNNLHGLKYVNDTTIWIVSDKGLTRFNSIKKSFKKFPFSDAGPRLSSNVYQ